MLQSPLTFLYIGLGWLIFSSLLGLAIFIGIVRGTPLPPALRLIHVHGALVGGILQILLAGVLMREWGPISAGTRAPSYKPMVLLNAATIGLSVGFWLRDHRLVGAAGLLLLLTLLMSAPTVWRMIRQTDRSFHHRLYFLLSLCGLYAGIGVGVAISFQWVEPWHGHARLSHIHLAVFLFAILSLVGLVRVILPICLRVRLRSASLDLAILMALLLGATGLITGFLLSSVSVQLVAGAVLVIGFGLNAYDLFRYWLDAGQPGNAWCDHLLVAMFFLLLTALLGIAVGINSLWYPPPISYGTLHIVAYTHTAFIGFLLQGVFGGLSYFLPIWLAQLRVASNKKRPAYLESLTDIMNRWRAVQTFSLSFGTLGLAVVATLTWTFPLGSPVIHLATWFSIGLLAMSFALFCAKIAHMSGHDPERDRVH
ncbi:MAG: hypothetical protein ABW047_08645 [Nitrospiraceae bacterium]